MTKKVIQQMLEELEEHHSTNKDELLTKYVQMRLNRSLETYYKEILTSYNVLSRQNEEKVLKTLAR